MLPETPIGSILGGVTCGWLIDPNFGEKALVGLAIGTVIGGFLQFGIQLPCLRKTGFFFKLDFNWFDPGIRYILKLTFPAIIAASAVQITVLINSGFASYLGKEAVTWLNSAFRLMQLPLGVMGVAIATITLPVISRIAATKETALFGSTLARALRLAIFLTLPAAVGLWFFSYPIIRFIFEHGKFNHTDAVQTSHALQYYAIGLVAYSCIKVLSPAFYAIDKKWTPMLVSLMSIALNIVFNYLLTFKMAMGHTGLALSTAISATINFIILYTLMKRWHNLENLNFLITLVRCMLASSVLGITCWGVLQLPGLLDNTSLYISAVTLIIAIFLASMVYFFMCLILQIDEAKHLFLFCMQRVRRFKTREIGV